MNEYKVLSKEMYNEAKRGVSLFSGDPVEIIGEQLVEADGSTFEQYLYNIEGYTAKNGLPFVSRKCNILISDPI